MSLPGCRGPKINNDSIINFHFIHSHSGWLHVVRTTGQQLYVLLRELYGLILLTDKTRWRILRFDAKVGHFSSTNFNEGEPVGCRSFLSTTLKPVKSLVVCDEWNIRLNLGIRGKYHKTFVGIPNLYLSILPSFFFHLDKPQVRHSESLSYYFLCSHESFKQVCNFIYSKPKGEIIFFCLIHKL